MIKLLKKQMLNKKTFNRACKKIREKYQVEDFFETYLFSHENKQSSKKSKVKKAAQEIMIVLVEEMKLFYHVAYLPFYSFNT